MILESEVWLLSGALVVNAGVAIVRSLSMRHHQRLIEGRHSGIAFGTF